MKTVFAVCALFMCASASAQTFPPIVDREAFISFRFVNGQCIPDELVTQLSDAGGQINRSTLAGRACCPSSAKHASPKLVDPALWRRIEPFADLSRSRSPEWEKLCITERMPMEEALKLSAKLESDRHEAQKKRDADEKRPVPTSWSELKQSAHPADVALIKSITSLKWWDACVAWGRESRAKTMSRRGTALNQYLESDKMLNAVDLANVRAGRLAIGQSVCGVFSVVGLPNKSNTTETSTKVRTQYVYQDRGIYVYVDGPRGEHNGIVTSIQY